MFESATSNTKAPSSHIQAPEKHQYSKLQTPRRPVWNLKFGVSLDVGAWCLEFSESRFALQPRLSNGTTRRSPGPMYCESGRINRLFASCSMMCAVQPV